MNTPCRFALLLIAATTALPATAQNLGTISGSVVRDGNQPASDAQVCLQEILAYPQVHGLLCPLQTETDSNGNFRFENVPDGSYTVSASKTGAGYGDPLGQHYFRKGPLAKVSLSPASPKAEVRLELGQRAAVLLIPKPTDAISGKPVGAQIITWRLDNPSAGSLSSLTNGGDQTPWAEAPWPGCCPADPTYRVLVPTDTDIGFVIMAAGYKPWPAPAMPPSRQPPGPPGTVFGDYYNVWEKIPLYPPSKEAILHLSPGEVHKLNVKLEPVSP